MVRGATPEEEELKAKQLSEKTHVDARLQGNYKFASENVNNERERRDRLEGSRFRLFHRERPVSKSVTG